MSKTMKSNIPPSEWQVVTLRLTAFPSATAQFANQNWWREIVGEEPETRTSQPRTGEQVETGPYKDGQIALVVYPARIDWQYRGKDEINPDSVAFPIIGSFSETITAFREF